MTADEWERLFGDDIELESFVEWFYGDTKGAVSLRDAMTLAMSYELGRRGGLIGGKRCMETMTAEQRRERAYKAARARWGTKSRPRSEPGARKRGWRRRDDY